VAQGEGPDFKSQYRKKEKEFSLGRGHSALRAGHDLSTSQFPHLRNGIIEILPISWGCSEK
jgi:hypothetical protein